MVPVDHVAEVGPVAAVVYARVVWRSERDGAWTATRQVIANETGLPLRSVRAALDLLRDRSWLAAEQGRGYDRTTTWRPVFAGQPQDADSVTCKVSNLSLPSDETVVIEVTESAFSSLETVETVETTTARRVEEQSALPLLTVVPTADDDPSEVDHFTRFWALWPSGRKVGKPKAQQAFTKALTRAPVEVIAAGLRAHLPAWGARVAAGEAGFVPHPTTWLNRDGWNDPPPVYGSRPGPRRNVFAEQSMGGPGAETMARFQSMLAGDQRVLEAGS